MQEGYSDRHARKAADRHQRRPVQARLTLLRALLCNAANDHEPTFSGVDNGRPYAGPSVAEWTVDTIAYFLGCWKARNDLALGVDYYISVFRSGFARAIEHEEGLKRWSERRA